MSDETDKVIIFEHLQGLSILFLRHHVSSIILLTSCYESSIAGLSLQEVVQILVLQTIFIDFVLISLLQKFHLLTDQF
jgi:hypothetical protein